MNSSWAEALAQEEFRRHTNEADGNNLLYFKTKWLELMQSTQVIEGTDPAEHAKKLQEMFSSHGPLGVYLALFQWARPLMPPADSEFNSTERKVKRGNRWVIVESPLSADEVTLQLREARKGLYIVAHDGDPIGNAHSGESHNLIFRAVDGEIIATLDKTKNYLSPYEGHFTPMNAIRRTELEFISSLNLLSAHDSIHLPIPPDLQNFGKGSFNIALHQVWLFPEDWVAPGALTGDSTPTWELNRLANNFIPLLQGK